MARRKARTSLAEWCKVALAPHNQTPAKHHLLLIKHLEDLARGDCDRLMVFMPPGSAKSTYVMLFAAWFMANHPNNQVIGASYSADLAKDISGRVQGYVRDNALTLGATVATENKDLWSMSNGSRYRAAGVGGSITGFRSDLTLVDDPVKGREEADSETMRDKAWNWYRADLMTRLRPGGRVVVVQTRWHESDLSGRLLQYEADKWRVVSLPATALENDPLGREPGELLWADDPTYPYADVLKRAKEDAANNGGMRDWYSLYEQDPRPLSGGLFETTKLGILDAAPAGSNIVRAWDMASTEQTGTNDPDWTVGVKMLRTAEDQFVILDVVRLRGGPDAVMAAILNTAALDGKNVKIFLAQDPGQAGKSQILDYTRRLMGYRVVSERPTGEKATRAAPLASQVNVGNVSLVRASWNMPLIEELRSFPSGRHDDIVDAAADAFSQLISKGGVTRVKVLY